MTRHFSKFKPYTYAYDYLPLEQRQGIAPRRGFCSIMPANRYQDALVTGNGTLTMLLYGEPLQEQVIFTHERLIIPRWKNGESPRPPHIADILPEVRQLERENKFTEASNLSLNTARLRGDAVGTDTNRHHPAFIMQMDIPKEGDIKGYLRTLDFMTGEVKVRWEDNRGKWNRRSFVSKPDKTAVQFLVAPEGGLLDVRLHINTDPQLSKDKWEIEPIPEDIEFIRDFKPDLFLLKGIYNKDFGNIGYAAVTRVIVKGGNSHMENNDLIVSGAESILLLTKVERYPEFEEEKVTQLVNSLISMDTCYETLLIKHANVHSNIMSRCELKLSSGNDYLKSVEELIAEQHSDKDISEALLDKLFDMGRYYLLMDSGEMPPIYGHTNINVNLQVCSGNLTNMPEAMEVFFCWIESMMEDFRENAHNIFGARGILADTHPDAENGLLYHFQSNYPHHYWISAAGWIYNEFWGHYLVSGDKEFLSNRVIPALKEIALFYEDYLSDVDEDGYSIFYPSYSPENWPSNTNCMTSINACMDIMVCREVLENLLEGTSVLGLQDEKVSKWNDMLEKLPPYLLDEEGALKEWAWPGLEERYNHRHVSHHYEVWPGNAITWEDTPELARAVLLSNRKRGQQDDSAHGIMHRAFTAARLKDSADVYFNLKEILEHGYINRSLMTNHYPYEVYFSDAIASLPALFVEMLVYSRPNVIELLPSLPQEILKGSLTGVCCFTFAKIESLAWDRDQKWIEVNILSLKDQNIELRYRPGFKCLTVDKKERAFDCKHFMLQFIAGQMHNVRLLLS